jgi:NIMA (never in mitosis gene a)-related kinase 1/4/5
MKGLYHKVIAGKYDPLPSPYSQDLKDMIAKCLKVRPSERTTCDKLLATPGLLNHITGTLKEIESPEEAAALMKTIRMPRNMDQIMDRLPG